MSEEGETMEIDGDEIAEKEQKKFSKISKDKNTDPLGPVKEVHSFK